MQSPVRFHSATTFEEVVDALDELGSEARLIAGGTDVMIQLARGELSPQVLLHIERVPGLGTVAAGEGGLHLGALVTHAMVRSDPATCALAALADAARQVGGWQTQAIGTVVGNIVNASPAADLTPGLLVHDAMVHLSRRGSERTLPLDQFVKGRRETAREPQELVTGITIARTPEHSGEAFVKVGRRKAMEVSIVAVATRLVVDPSTGTIADARVAVGAVSPIPHRAPASEQLLIGQRPTADLFAAAGRAALEGADPIDDVRASRRYRLAVLPRAVAQALSRSSDHVDAARSVA